MPLQLKGIQKVRAVRKDGSKFTYHYYRVKTLRVRLHSEPNSPDYLAEYAAAVAKLSAHNDRDKISFAGSLVMALEDFKSSDNFRTLPLRIRSEFLSVITWLPPKDANRAVTKITADYARHLRDKAARSRGAHFGNCALVLLQSAMGHFIANGTLTANPAVAIPKLDLPHSVTNNRRMISSERARGRLSDSTHSENHNGRGIIDGPGK